MRRVRAFSLVEMLVSIALVAIVAALLMSALGKVRATVNEARCLANLRILGNAMRGFTLDHNGYFTPHTSYPFFETSPAERIRKSPWHWMSYLAPYLGSPDYKGTASPALECPADPKVKTWPTLRPYIPAMPGDSSYKLCSYGYNYYYLTTSMSWWRAEKDWPANTNQIKNVDQLIILTDGRESSGSLPDPLEAIVNPFIAVNFPSMRHRARFNAFFLDGHVASMEPAAASATAYWRPK